ncbi:MAG: fibronectin type III domain-containing protein [Nitrospira sp.]|nr:fibronectin type III domain-containing protein [Nitrospira sp.]
MPPSVVTPPTPSPAASPAIGVSSSNFSFSAQQNAGNPPAQTLAVTNRGGGTLIWNATASAAWLTLSPAAGSGNGTIAVTASTSSLTAGTYNTIIMVNAVGTSTITIPVNLTIAPAPVPPAIGASPTSFSFTVQRGGGNPAAQTLNISNTGGGTLTWTASDNAPWLTLSPATGTNNGAVSVSAATGSLAVGTYSGTIIISAPGVRSTSIPVTFTVAAAPVPPRIGTSPTTLSFTAQQGAGNPAAQTLNIGNTGGGTLTWTASDNAPWLTLSQTSGTGNGTIIVTAATGSLAAGTYNAMIALGSIGATTIQIPVTFTVAPAPTTITLSPPSLTYTAVSGSSNPASQSMIVNSNGSWTASDNAAWLTLNPTSGSGNGTISASINLGGVLVGTHTATITVTGGGTVRNVNVALTVSAASFTISPASLTFTATQGAANPPTQTITLNSTGSWTASDNSSWLSLSPTSGQKNGVITASVNTANAKPGNNPATITVTSGGVTKTANVTLTLNAPASSSATLTWNANKENDLAGYKVYRATASGTYGAPIATLPRNVTTYQATGLQFGKTYFFVVTAYDIAGNESGYSNEVSKSIF